MRLLKLISLTLLLAGCSSVAFTSPPTTSTVTPSSVPSQAQLRQVHDPGTVTGSLQGPCHTRDNNQLPDPRCTPGAIDPTETKAVICKAGFTTKTYRPPVEQTDAAKFNVVEPAYGLQGKHGELDHLVPLELGGANDLSNLWVEVGAIPNAKDTVENTLHDMVCTGRISLHDAQERIATNWLTALNP
jgi:hypothetical protein